MAELKNIRIAVSGIYDYALEELPSLRVAMPGKGAPDWVEEKRIYKVYRPAETLRKACDKFKLLPLTHHHPQSPVDQNNFRDLTIGYTGENPFIDYIAEKDEVGIRSNVMLGDQEAINAYNRGEIQLSPGYVAEFEWKKGTDPHGNAYDIVMKEITGVNHLALLPAGRGGSYAVVLDEAPKRETIFNFVKNKNVEDRTYNIGEISEKTGLQKTAEGWKPPKKEENNKSNNEWRNEIKEHLANIKGKALQNIATGITAQLSSEGINKMTSGAAIKKSVDNGFTGNQHFEAVKKVVELYKNAKLIKTHEDKNGNKDVLIKRFVAQDKMNDGTEYDALITLKESTEHGHRIYSLELDEINKAALRWTVNDDGTLTPENEPSTGNSLSIRDNESKVKSIFERVQGTVFDRYRK